MVPTYYLNTFDAGRTYFFPFSILTIYKDVNSIGNNKAYYS